MKGNTIQWHANGEIVDSEVLDTILKDGNTVYLVRDKETGHIHTLAPEMIHVINP